MGHKTHLFKSYSGTLIAPQETVWVVGMGLARGFGVDSPPRNSRKGAENARREPHIDVRLEEDDCHAPRKDERDDATAAVVA
jgi:hypothetical protein